MFGLSNSRDLKKKKYVSELKGMLELSLIINRNIDVTLAILLQCEILMVCEQDRVGISAKYSFTQTGK